ncbi:hypothetical protein ROA7450_02903 [Roseovarius albus]|uniref:Microcystinase C n=1 Tax=Roseovarius albus TaxID=1247867 RepID=A0A1X6ZMX5_9RHOB|nr:M81 family metallopeptidase [Roseovarius albus]SLN56142.1 hypothetical protein ROA7450_02903 [Roseovarius albus]
MRLFMATLSTETNTFSPMPTGPSGFNEYFLRHGDATQEPPNLMTEALHIWRAKAEALGWDVVESLSAIAEPAGRTMQSYYEALRDEILGDLELAGGADIVLLQLHGAMVAEDEDDCEGDIITRVRTICPDAVLGLALDQHCHLTEQMMQASDLIVAFKEYPHDDATARAEELFDMARQTAAGEINPVMASYDCRMVHMYLTKTGAMRGFVDRLSATEQEPGILSVTLAHGFPWADVEDVGTRMLVIADGAPHLAQETSERLAQEFFALRHEVTGQFVSLDQALEEAMAHPYGPVVLADMGDNSGGGAPGDSTFVLRAILERGLANVTTGIYWDPAAVRICEDAGENAHLTLRIGGKTCADSGDPVDISVSVMKIAKGLGQHLGKGLEPLGTMVWLKTANDIDILINDLRTQVYHPEAFTQLGIDLKAKHLVTVKSLFHFYAPFAEIAAKVIQVATPGGTSPRFAKLPLTKRTTPWWPRDEDPFSVEEISAA